MNKRKKTAIAGGAFLFLLFATLIALLNLIDYTPANELFELIAEKRPKNKSAVRALMMEATAKTEPTELEYLHSNTFIMKMDSRVPYIISLIGDEENWHLFASPESRGPYINDPVINKILFRGFDIEYHQALFLDGKSYQIRKY